MSTIDFENLLKRAMGLDTASIGASVVAAAVQKRVKACGLLDTQTYWQHLNSSKLELQELIEAVVVPETWFLRDREAFHALTRVVHTEWLPAHPGGELRMLSIPCSTGEEPYSMAIALLDTGFPVERLRIDAVDISERAIEKAQRAIYGKNSFRGADIHFRNRYFQQSGRDWKLSETVRKHVHFRQGNLFDPDVFPGSETYDIIFCRNLLIYFDLDARDRAIRTLLRLLTVQGLLFVGPSETGLLLPYDLVSAKMPLAFAFRKAGALVRVSHAKATLRRKISSIRLPQAATHARKQLLPQPAAPSSASSVFNEIERLANEGNLVEAATSCEAYLREHGPSAQALHLLGVIHGAIGNHTAAAEHYRKALYLEPQHHEALIHLAFLLEKQGDARGARVLRERVQRLESKAAG
jgi:chemotaxis protein methyltransferase WspC